MKYISKTIEADSAYIVPIADMHIGDKNFDEELLQQTINYVQKTPNTYVIGVGDWLNVATKNSKSSSFQQNLTLGEQIDKVNNMFLPIKDRVIGMVQGNHEKRIEEFCGYDPLIAVCSKLECQYLKYSAVVSVVLKPKANSGIAYTFYVHHTTGGGSTPGSKINRINKLRNIVCNADVYLGGHNHALGVMPVVANVIDVNHQRVIRKRQVLVDCGSYLTWDEAYSEQMMLEPVKLGSPRIRLNGVRRDVHVSV